MRLALGIPGDEELAAFLMLGTPAKTPVPREDTIEGLLSIWK
ncbi:MAG: hypothetical protein ABI391_06710 [Hyphomicrobiaceae bacterium]